MKFFIKDFFSKCDQIRSYLRIWSHLMKKFLTKNFIYCAVRIWDPVKHLCWRFFVKVVNTIQVLTMFAEKADDFP